MANNFLFTEKTNLNEAKSRIKKSYKNRSFNGTKITLIMFKVAALESVITIIRMVGRLIMHFKLRFLSGLVFSFQRHKVRVQITEQLSLTK